MTQPRDVDLQGFLDGVGFHPANTERKQYGHELARQMVGEFGAMLHDLLPPGRDKSITFTLLEDVLMRANRALAIGDGPQEHLTTEFLRDEVARHRELPQDPRIEQYKAEQRGEVAGQQPLPDDFVTAEGSPEGDFYEATINTNDPETNIRVTGSEAAQQVQVAVLSTAERVQNCLEEQQAGGPEFTGFYASIETTDAASALLREIAAASAVAFRGEVPA